MQKFLSGELKPFSICPMVYMRPLGDIQTPKEVWHVDENNILEVFSLESNEDESMVPDRRNRRIVTRDGLTQGMVACL